MEKKYQSFQNVEQALKKSWTKIAPCWSLKNFIAVNPLQGLQELPIEEALEEAEQLFESKTVPQEFDSINAQTIKWLQVFLDQGQATISMPLKNHGFYTSWKSLALYDTHLHKNNIAKKEWLSTLPDCPKTAIMLSLSKLKISDDDFLLFFTLMLTTLSGWSSYIKYLTDWAEKDLNNTCPITAEEYIAVRTIITALEFENPDQLITWYKSTKSLKTKNNYLDNISKNEQLYLSNILKKLNTLDNQFLKTDFQAQLVFCIDVRSESFRRILENQGPYETFGFAGFFGIPVRIKNSITQESYAACPVLLKPKHTITQSPTSPVIDHKWTNLFKSLYQSLKYNMTTPFGLIELIGLPSAIWMALKTISPKIASTLKKNITTSGENEIELTPCLDNIEFHDQCLYAESALKGMGLIKNFSNLIVFCGHASTTENNAYFTALDCGACGGHHGGSNAKILAKILNNQKIRSFLKEKNILIPETTHFIAAEHNTTTDQIEIYNNAELSIEITQKIDLLKLDLKKTQLINSIHRCKELRLPVQNDQAIESTYQQSIDWTTTRPEWGLAKNASFIIAPRAIIKDINLQARSFLHSYDYFQDQDGSILTLILTAPMIVAQWINAQYLFSTLNNVSYGSGSKITQNITGKFGIMQGNMSDLMSGLPLQSVYITDKEPYHQPVRLMVFVYAPHDFIDAIIQKQPLLKTLFKNGWILLISITPNNTKKQYLLNRDLTWQLTKYNE